VADGNKYISFNKPRPYTAWPSIWMAKQSLQMFTNIYQKQTAKHYRILNRNLQTQMFQLSACRGGHKI